MNKEIMSMLGFDEQMALIEQGLCPCCQKEIGKFKNTKSVREYEISGMCQKCQDKTFGV
jgi:hypothetical protein